MSPVPFLDPASLVGRTEPVDLDDALDGCLGGGVVVTINRRLARALTGRFERRRAEAGATFWETPVIVPLGGWLERLHDAALASGASQRARLGARAAERTWQGIVDGDKSLPPLLAPFRAARSAKRAWGLAHAWRCLPDDTDYLSRDQFHWRRWSEAYAATLEEGEFIDDATLADHVAALIAEGNLALPANVTFAGFLQPTPLQLDLVDALRAAGVRVAHVADPAPVTPAQVRWADDADELAGIADAVFRRVRETPDAALGVVVPDLESRRDEVLRAFDRRFFPALTPAEIESVGRPYDLSYGRSLADVAPIRAALLVLELVVGGLSLDDVSTLLLCPYLEAADVEARERERLDRRLRERRVQGLGLRGLATWVGENSALRGPLFALAARMGSEPAVVALSAWAERFGERLRAFGWPGPAPGSAEHQAVGAWYAVLDDLAALDDGRELGARAALGLVRTLAAERLFQPETPDGPIRIVGRLESHGQRFDVAWVMGLDADRWPAAGQPDPFLPVARQRSSGMPEASAAVRLALARRELAHWCASAPEITLCCAAERDDQALEAAFAFDATAVAGHHESASPLVRMREAVTRETVEDRFGPAYPDEGRARGGARLLEMQAKCPMRAFVEHRLGGREIELAAIGLGKRRQGTLLHAALEAFWKETIDQARLLAMDAGALADAVERAVDAALEAERPDAALRRLERTRLLVLLHRWMEDVERPRPPFAVVAVEQSRETVRGGLSFSLKIDRIDRVDGRLVVVDYKTGSLPVKDQWLQERMTMPQLPLYASSDAGTVGMAFAAVARRRPRFTGIAVEAGLLPGLEPADGPEAWSMLRDHWSDALDEVAGEAREGYAAVRPWATKECKSCPVRAVCRRDVSAS